MNFVNLILTVSLCDMVDFFLLYEQFHTTVSGFKRSVCNFILHGQFIEIPEFNSRMNYLH